MEYRHGYALNYPALKWADVTVVKGIPWILCTKRIPSSDVECGVFRIEGRLILSNQLQPIAVDNSVHEIERSCG